MKVGVEGYFYSENGDPFLDETISFSETGLAGLIESLRIKLKLHNRMFRREQLDSW